MWPHGAVRGRRLQIKMMPDQLEMNLVIECKNYLAHASGDTINAVKAPARRARPSAAGAINPPTVLRSLSRTCLRSPRPEFGTKTRACRRYAPCRRRTEPVPQPNLVPVNFSPSRITHINGVAGGASVDAALRVRVRPRSCRPAAVRKTQEFSQHPLRHRASIPGL